MNCRIDRARWLIALFMCTLVCVRAGRAQDAPAQNDPNADGVQFFEKQVAPLLKRRCYQCHSHESGKAKGGLVLDSRRGWEKGGSQGAAVVPGKPEESLLIEAVRYAGMEMPPEQQLPAGEISLLEKWIRMGAPDPRMSPVTKPSTQQWWALQPIAKPPVPQVQDTSWPQDPLDAFVLRQLEASGLHPSGDADRYTLLRRVTFDLTGLPPTPEEIVAFVDDTSERAYEKVVDRLLDSPGFGDHWARHWFDVSCYADLADIQGTVLIRDAWRYRDYVIAAMSADKPLDRFIHEQIAGDLLPFGSIAQRREQIIATGYLAIGPWTLQNYIKKQLDADVVDHQIDRIGRTFLAQTIACARCHDHKFDPIPTADYYALAGIFHSTRTTSYDGPGVWSVINETPLPKPQSSPEEQARRDALLADLRAEQQALQADLTRALLKIPGGSQANVLTLEQPIVANQQGVEYQLSLLAGPSVWSAASQGTASSDGLQVDLLRGDGSALAGFRHNPGAWSGDKDSQQLTLVRFQYTGDGSGKLRVRLTTATPGSGRFGGAVDDLTIRAGGVTLFSEDFDDLQPGPIKGRQANTQLTVFARASVPGWTGDGLNHTHAVEHDSGNYAVQFFGGNVTGLASAKPSTPAEKEVHARAIKLDQQLQAIAARLSQLQQQDAAEHALSVRDVAVPRDSPIYRRGDFQNLGDVVPRRFLSAVGGSTDHSIPPDASGRRQLAAWLTDSENPLTSRVLVNRIWHHLFGQGIVRTVDYFGVHGETPSHPELLEFLASRLREDDSWSLKRTVRRMVLSRTYQMASTYNRRAAATDPDNRLLWQMPRRRLPAESIRDAMLAASGQLDPARGGPSLGLELPGNIRGAGGNVNPPTWGNKIPEAIKNRRTIYQPLQRARPEGDLEILSVFDFPHPNDMVGARPQTTVATQALFLMNAPFVKQQSAALAMRLAKDEPANEAARVNRLYLLTLGRPAAAGESAAALAFLDDCTKELQGDRPAAWAQLCHAMLGCNGFLFRE